MNKFGIGSLINYDLVDQVGEGTYGYVYKATDRRSGETVALKRYYQFLTMQRSISRG